MKVAVTANLSKPTLHPPICITALHTGDKPNGVTRALVEAQAFVKETGADLDL